MLISLSLIYESQWINIKWCGREEIGGGRGNTLI